MARVDLRARVLARQGNNAADLSEEQIQELMNQAARQKGRKASAKKGPVVMPSEENPKEETPKKEKRGRGRPKKHTSGGQISIWFNDDVRAAVMQRAMVWRCSFSDAVNHLLLQAMKK